MIRIGDTTHGESRLRMLRLVRRGDRHDPHDLTVSLRFEGDFSAAFTEGRPAGVVPGEALKNLVHTTARQHTIGDIESFGIELCRRALEAHPQITKIRADLSEQPWQRMEVGGKAQGQAFIIAGPEQRTAAITSNGTQVAVVSGIERLTLMRSAGFAAPGSRPNLREEANEGLPPLVVGSLSVRWTYSTPDVTFGAYRQGIRGAVLETIALHASRSVQHTLYAIGDVLLASYPEVSVIWLAMHERPYRPADLFHAQLENPDEVFVALDEPVGIVELTLERHTPPNPNS
jgi:urate oxidase